MNQEVEESKNRLLFWALTISLLMVFTVTPVIEHGANPGNVFNIVSLCLAMLVVGTSKLRFSIGLLLGIPALTTGVLSYSQINDGFTIAFYCLTMSFFLFVIINLIRDIFSTQSIHTNQLLAAICAYLSFSIVWGMGYCLAESFQQGSFNLAANKTQPDINDLMYFSIVTLTSLGYGDITPASNLTRSLATSQVLVGQVYLTFLVARLVGLNVASR